MEDPRVLFLSLANENKHKLPTNKKIVINLLESMLFIIKDYIEMGRNNGLGMSRLELKYGYMRDETDTGLIMYIFDNIPKIEIDYYTDHLLEINGIIRAYL